MIYPWQAALWQRLTDAFTRGKLPHALLFSGIADIGKTAFVATFVRFILCSKRKEMGLFCDTQEKCHACHLVETNVHPNLHSISPTTAGHAIKIDQIRDMIEFATHSAVLGQYQCIIINPAQQMNQFAANALLKTLEEPAPNVFLFLVTTERSRLPATIVSRTMHVTMPVPRQQMALTWLQQQLKNPADKINIELALTLAMGAPLRALTLIQKDQWETRKLVYQVLQTMEASPSSFMRNVSLLQEVETEVLFNFVLSWVMDMVKIKCGVAIQYIQNHDYTASLQEVAEGFSQEVILTHLRRITTMYHDFTQGVNMNKSLLIENILLHFMRHDHVFS
jgi:DNA polymerase III subunit delta'